MNGLKKFSLTLLLVVLFGMSAFAGPGDAGAGSASGVASVGSGSAEKPKQVSPVTPAAGSGQREVGVGTKKIGNDEKDTETIGGDPANVASGGNSWVVIFIVLSAVGALVVVLAIYFLYFHSEKLASFLDLFHRGGQGKSPKDSSHGVPPPPDDIAQIKQALGTVSRNVDSVLRRLQSYSPDEQLRTSLSEKEEELIQKKAQLTEAQKALEAQKVETDKARQDADDKAKKLESQAIALTEAQKALEDQKVETEKARQDADDKAKKLKTKTDELETAQKALEDQKAETAKVREDAQAEAKVQAEAVNRQLLDLEKQYNDAVNERDDFYGKDCEKLRVELLEKQKLSSDSCRMLVAAWLRLAVTKQMFPDELRRELESFDATVWRIFSKGDLNEEALNQLRDVRHCFAGVIDKLLDGTALAFMWPEPGTPLEGHDDEFSIESGYRAVRYAQSGLIRRDGEVVRVSSVVCEDA